MSLFKQTFKIPKVQEGEYFDVFLGGTTNFTKQETDWRSIVINKLKPNVLYFNPVVPDWDEWHRVVEEKAKQGSTYRLYVITPQMTGVYSIAEMVHDSIQLGDRVIICALPEYSNKSFSEAQLRSLDATLNMCGKYKANILYTLDAVTEYLNSNVRG